MVIPVYNEERALPGAVETLSRHLEGSSHDWKIVVADNASIDRDSIERKIRQARERAERARRPQ